MITNYDKATELKRARHEKYIEKVHKIVSGEIPYVPFVKSKYSVSSNFKYKGGLPSFK